jgi:glycosyltransferase involved in cell wall biosynthesis
MLAFARRVLRPDVAKMLGEADVVVGSSPPLFAAWGAARLARRLRTAFVLEVRDLWPASLVHLGAVRPWHPAVWALGRLERWLYRAADAIVSVLPGAVATIRKTAGRGEALPITWVPNGVDLSLVAPEHPSDSPGSRGDGFEVMYAGAHNLANALDSVLDAAAILQADPAATGIRITLIGDGPEKPRLQARAANLGLTNVVFEPPVSKTEIYAKLRAADAFVLAIQDLPLYRHGISINKLYDYLASAKPVIFAGAASNDPVAESGGGVVVRPGDPAALARAVTQVASLSREARAEMGGRGRRYIEAHHDTVRLAEDFEAVVAAAVEAASASARS